MGARNDPSFLLRRLSPESGLNINNTRKQEKTMRRYEYGRKRIRYETIGKIY